MVLYYVRHGHPIYSPDKLTALGKRQAEAVGKRLAMLGVDRIFSSTSNRAIETALPLSEMTGVKIELVDFANELHMAKNFKVDNGTGKKQWVSDIPDIRRLLAKPQIKTDFQWYEHPDFERYSFQQGIERIQREADIFFENLGYKHIRENGYYEPISPTKERIAFFAHAEFGKMFMSFILDIPYPQMVNQFSMEYTGMTVLTFEEKFGYCIPNVQMYSGDGHIYKEGLPKDYRIN